MMRLISGDTSSISCKNYSARVALWRVGKLVRPMFAHPEESRVESASTFNQLITRIKHFGPVALGFPWNVIDDFGK
jgi:hypothetical protein